MAHECAAALEAALSPDKATRDKALEWLERFRDADFGGFLVALSGELRNTERSALCRQQAGLQMKNALYSKDTATADFKGQKWLALDAGVRDIVKQSALASLGTETYSPSSAPQVVSSIALIEIPASQWPVLMGQLCDALKNPAANETYRIAFLETIGYICEDLSPSLLQDEANNILTVIVQNMRSTEPNTRVKLAAATALLNSLDFCRANFEREAERNFLMQVTCELTQCPDVTVSARALECLVRIINLYYDFMAAYIPALFGIATQAMQSKEESVANQAIEFWSTLADVEYDIEYDDEANMHEGKDVPSRHQHFCRMGVATVVPVLLGLLTQAEDDEDDDEWNTSKAASVCLNLLGNVVRDELRSIVVPFVSENVSHAKWQHRDAAILAFGAIIDSPHAAVAQLVSQAFPHLLGMMKDPVAAVKDSVAWLLSRIIKVLPELVLVQPNFSQLFSALVAGLQMEARVAANCCWAMNFVADKLCELHCEKDDSDMQTWLLSEHFDPLINLMFATVERADAAQHGLRLAGFEALMELFRRCPPDCYPIVKSTTIRVLQSLQSSLGVRVQDSDMLRQISEAQALLCGLLGVLVSRLQDEDLGSMADGIAQVLVSILAMASASGSKDVIEDCFTCISALTNGLHQGIAKYMDALNPTICGALSDFQDYQVCLSAVGVVSDVVRALGELASPLVAIYTPLLLNALSDSTLNRTVKPHIVDCFGDFAASLGANFKPYEEVTLTMLSQAALAAQMPVDPEDYDALDAANDLRTSVLQAFAACLSFATSSPAELQVVMPYVVPVLSFMDVLVQQPALSDACTQAILGLFGDLCKAYGKPLATTIPGTLTSMLFKPGAFTNPKTAELGRYALQEYQKIRA